MAAEINAPQAVRNFLRGFIGERPIFANGVQIGYWRSGSQGDLCRGVIMLFKTAGPLPPPETWITKDGFWRDVRVTDLCLSLGIRPKWATEKDIPNIQPSKPITILPGVAVGSDGQNALPLIAAGGAAALGLLLLLRR